MSIGELARQVGRSVDTIKRWEEQGLVRPDRDDLGRRRYALHDVERCRELGSLAIEAQRLSMRLPDLVRVREPLRLPFSIAS